MAENNPSSAELAGLRGIGLELRLEQGRVFACLSEKPLVEGARVVDLAMEVPDVRFPFDVGQGAGQFSRRLCDLARLEIAVSQEFLSRIASHLDLTSAGLNSLALALRSRFLEGSGQLEGGVPFTFRAAVEPEGEQILSVVVYEVRFYGPAALPSAGLPLLLARATAGLADHESGTLRFDPLPAGLRKLLPSRGWKLPRTESIRLSGVTVTPTELRLVWDRGLALSPRASAAPPDGPPAPPLPPPIGGRLPARVRTGTAPAMPGQPTAAPRSPLPADEGLLAALEGARAFQEAESLLLSGEWDAAREAYLANGSATTHPFAAARLLSLLAHDPRFHDEALDLAAHWLARKPDFACALLTEGVLRIQRGEIARASHSFAELAAVASRRGEEFGALTAAEACIALGDEADPAAMARAVETALALRRDHLPALRALAKVAEKSGDRESLLRACRRLAAYAPDDTEKARAHARLAEMLLRTDAPSARLHLDQALRLAPDDAASLSALARACEEAGEHLRALRAHDRLREIHLAKGDREAAIRSALIVGQFWEERLGHPENALLRYREAAELDPNSTEARERAARLAETLGHWAEAADHYSALLVALGAGRAGEMTSASRAHRALARIARERLNDPIRAASHLEAALVLEPRDTEALTNLVSLYRELKRPSELLGVLDRLAPLTPKNSERAVLLAEAGTACLNLAMPDAAHSRLVSALALDSQCRPALEGLRRCAVERGDAQAEREALARLVLTARHPGEQAALYEQLSRANEHAGDLVGAARALASARRAEPTSSRLGEAVRLARLAGDGVSLAGLLVEQAADARTSGDTATALAAFTERATLLRSSDPAAALAALTEARTLAPDNPAVLQAQADLAEASGDHRLALEALQALLAAGGPDAGTTELRTARLAQAAGDLQAAREHAQRALDVGEKSAVDLLGEILELSGDRAARAELLERIGRFADAASLWTEIGSPEKAHQALERASVTSDSSAVEQILPALVEARLAANNRTGAAEAMLRLARLRGGTEGARLAIRAAETDPSTAVAAFDLAVASDPSSLVIRAARARHAAGRDPSSALSDCETVLAADSLEQTIDLADRRTLRRLASSLASQLGRGDEARRHLSLYCSETPDDIEALRELSRLSRAAGDETSLCSALERLRNRVSGAEASAIQIELAQLRLRSGAATEALELLREVLIRDPANPSALEAILGPELQAHLPLSERNSLVARFAATPAISETQRAELLLKQAQLLSSSGAPEDATAALQMATEVVRLRPRDPGALELVAALAGRTGDQRAAAEALLARSVMSREAGESDAAARRIAAGQAALAAGLVSAGEEALKDALSLGLDPDEARLVWKVLADQARQRQDGPAELATRQALVPLLRTGERPSHLMRIAELQLAGGDLEKARLSAEEARTLSPRNREAFETCRQIASQQEDWPAVAQLLAEIAELDPEQAGQLALERARLLSRMGRAEEADRAFSQALQTLPPDAALASEQSRSRRDAPPPVRDRPWGAPLEAFARRTSDSQAAALALREAAHLALIQDDSAAAIRCARRAYARTQEDPAFAGPLLALVLYRQGAGAEALVLHRRLFESGFPGIDEGDRVVLCRQLAELAEDAGEFDLALAALEQLLALRPQDAEAAERRFRLDPDRSRAVRALAEHASTTRSARRKALALAMAAGAAHRELADPAVADAFWRKAEAAAGDYPNVLAELESERLDAARRDYDPASPQVPSELLAALHDAAAARESVPDRAAQRMLLEEAVELESRHGLLEEALADLKSLEEIAVSQDRLPDAAAFARRSGLLILERTRALDRAEVELRRAIRRDRSDELAWRGLEAIARARGNSGALLLGEALAARAELSQDPRVRADLLAALSTVLAGPLQEPGRAIAALRAALSLVPGHTAALENLAALYRTLNRPDELSSFLLERADRSANPAERLALRREAAGILSTLPDDAHRARAAEAYQAALADAPGDLALERAVATLLLGLGRQDEAVPHLVALVRAQPDDEELAHQLAEAYAGRPREQARLWLERATAAQGEACATRLREAALLLRSVGDEEQARQLLRQAFDAWPADDTAFREALRFATADIDRLNAVLVVRAEAVPSEAAGCHRARADALLTAGRAEDAFRAYQELLALAPDDVAALAMVAEHLAQHEGDAAAAEADARLLAIAQETPTAVPITAEARARYRAGLLAWAHGDPQQCVSHLERALALAPSDPRVGPAWAALANGYASQGMGAEALRAARSRFDRARQLGLAEEHREALEAGAALAAQFEDHGEDSLVLLESLIALRVEQAPDDPELDTLLERAAGALSRSGENVRAEALFAMAARGMDAVRRKGLLLRIAEMALARGDRSAGRAAWAQAQTLDPSDSALRQQRLTDARESGEPSVYAAVLEESLAVQPGEAALMLDLARARLSLGDPSAAAVWYQRLVEIGPSAPGYDEAQRALGVPSSTSPESQSLAAGLQERAPATKTPPSRVEAHLAAAASLEQAGASIEEIRGEIENACSAAPDDVAGWTALADLESRRGDPLAAARAYLAIAIRSEGEAATLAALRAADTFEAAARFTDATRAYATALQTQPGNYLARRALARMAEQAGDLTAAVEHLSAVDASQIPAEVRAEYTRLFARTLETASRSGEAQQLWTEIFSTDPGDAEAYDRLAQWARAQLQYEEWLALTSQHEAAVSGDVLRRLHLRCERARLLEELGRFEAAEGAWRAAVELDPNHAAAKEGLEALLGNRTAWQEAAEKLQLEAESCTDPEAASALLVRCARILHEKLADTDGAARALEGASRKPPGQLEPSADEGVAETLERFSSEQTAKEEIPSSTEPTEQPVAFTAEAPPQLELEAEPAIQPATETAEQPVAFTAEAPPRLELETEPAIQPATEPTEQPAAFAAEAPPQLELEAEQAVQPAVTAGPVAPSISLGDELGLEVDIGDLALAGEPAAPLATQPAEVPTSELDDLLEAARGYPGDGTVLESLAIACRQAAESETDRERVARLLERARIAEALVLRTPAGQVLAELPPLALRVPPDVREQAAAPGAVGPMGRLLSLLAPWLEGLFPANLGRLGATLADRIGPTNAPWLLARVESASRALSTRSLAVFLSHRPGVGAGLENTHPPSLVLYDAALRSLRPSALAFLLARQLDLCGSGWALIGKFAPHDVSILGELACLFAGTKPPPQGLPSNRADAFVEALASRVPAEVREQATALAPAAAEELGSFDPRAFAVDLVHTANRVALIYTGEPRGALEVLSQLRSDAKGEPPQGVDEHSLSPEALDIGLFALSDLYLELRLLLIG